MYKLCKTEQSALRQRELEHHLLSMMATLRLDEISVSDLCAHAGVSRKAFYRYFSGKDGALYALIDHTLLELDSFLYSENPPQGPGQTEILARFFAFWQDRRALLDALVYSGVTEVFVERMILHAATNTSANWAFLSGSDEEMGEFANAFCVSGISSMVLMWHRKEFRTSLEHMVEITVPLLTKPLIEMNHV